MAQELVANSPTPGTVTAITTLGAAVSTTGATSITTAAAAPVALQTAGGQFRIVIDSEILIVTAGANTTTWTVTRGAEGSTAATHANAAPIFHFLTAGALAAFTPAIAFGTAAAQPAASTLANKAYYATDTNELTVSDGTTWRPLGQTTFNWVVTGNEQVNGSIFVNGSLDCQVAGGGIKVAEGANCKQGVYGPLVAGTLLVANTRVTASSRIFVCRSPGGTNPGAHHVSAAVVGTSFTVTSTSATDTGSGVFEIFEPG